MKKHSIKTCMTTILLLGTASLQAAASHLAAIPTTVCESSAGPCTPPSTSHCVHIGVNTVACFDSPVYCSDRHPGSDARTCFESQNLLTDFLVAQNKDDRRNWEDFLAKQDASFACTETEDVTTSALCPLENEPLQDYVHRIFAATATVDKDPNRLPLIMDNTFRLKLFQDAPWHVQRYLAAVVIQLNAPTFDINEPLPASGITLLDHAAREEDIDFIIHVLDRGASFITARLASTKKIIADLMLRSSNPRSAGVLQKCLDSSLGTWVKMSEQGIQFSFLRGGWFDIDMDFGLPFLRDNRFDIDMDNGLWAKDQPASLVITKAKILSPHITKFAEMGPGRECIKKEFALPIAESIKGTSPGELALKQYFLDRAGYCFELNCSIL